MKCKAVQNDAGIIDISGSSKFIISGEGANDFLNYLSCNKIPQEKGSIGLAVFHSSNGGIMTEQSITKIDDEKFFLMGPIGSELRDLHWMNLNANKFDVKIENQTDDLGGMLLTGPKSRDILQKITKEDISNSSLPWLKCHDLTIDLSLIHI